jgi:hypothetical protein
MSYLLDLHMLEAPLHGVLKDKNPMQYDLRELRVTWDQNNWPDGCIDLEISSQNEYLCLQFTGISDLTVPLGDVITTVAIGIFDTTNVPGAAGPIRFQHPKSKSTVAAGGLSFWAQSMTLMERR